MTLVQEVHDNGYAAARRDARQAIPLIADEACGLSGGNPENRRYCPARSVIRPMQSGTFPLSGAGRQTASRAQPDAALARAAARIATTESPACSHSVARSK